jgi:hypothetical protein
MGDVIKFTEQKKEVPSLYSNVVGVTVGPYDFVFSWGYKSPEQAQQSAKDAADNWSTLAYVAISPSQAKTVLVLLKEMVDKYESDFGEIPMEDKFKKRYQKIFGG